MSDYRLTPRALEDLDAIARYTIERWGRDQARTYLNALTGRMSWLANGPELGRRRDDVSPGYRCFREGQHLIFYVEADFEIRIIGVPHVSMDITAHLK